MVFHVHMCAQMRSKQTEGLAVQKGVTNAHHNTLTPVQPPGEVKSNDLKSPDLL